ncbi:MAG: gluconeogenesis factor YvcK family protein [Microthrixaceae bacterium]
MSAGPRVVAVGGGHGLAASLRAVRGYAGEVTAVVAVADDGGSTGRLRRATPRPAPGDLRKCLVALAGQPSALSRAMEHRFADGELAGHAFGNLLIAALEESEGDLVRALDEVGLLLGAVGRVLPATSVPVELRAVVASGGEVHGQVAVAARADVERITLEPPDAPACSDAVRAILTADQVVLGPGSLFTSVLAATAVEDIGRALRDTAAPLVYVCNLRPQGGESEGYGVVDHVQALARHGVEPDVVIHDPSTMASPEPGELACAVVAATVARPSGLAHDPDLLGAVLAGLV